MSIRITKQMLHNETVFAKQCGFREGVEAGKKEFREQFLSSKQKAHIDLAQALAKGIEANSLALQTLSRCIDEGLLK